MKPQAFPSLFQDALGIGVYHEPGMTLRDYFAAKALPWALAQERQFLSLDESIPSATNLSYRIADAMMEARERS